MKARAALIEAVGQGFTIGEIELADPIGREVLVQVKAVGLCQTDLNFAREQFGLPMPVLLGHEVAGVVVAVGPGVTSVAVGDHVVGCLVSHCGHCDRCNNGRQYSCSNPNETRRARDLPPRVTRNGAPVTQMFDMGGFAEYSLTHENNLVLVGKDLPFDKACLLGCSVVTGAGAALRSAALNAGDRIVVIGCGGVGLNVVQGGVLAGARQIVAVDVQQSKLDMATSFGATDTVDASQDGAVEKVLQLTGGGADAVFEVAGLVQTTHQALAMLAKDGTAYLIGVHKPANKLELSPLAIFNGGQKGIKGVSMGSTNPNVDIPLFADLYLRGRYNLDDLVSRTISLDEINEGYEAMKGGEVARTVILF